MIELKGLDNIRNTLNSITDTLKDIDSEDYKKKLNEGVFELWHKEELPQIFETSGTNIHEPFRDKKSLIWNVFREFDAPGKWMLGVWSGEAYRALEELRRVGSTINIIKNITGENIEFGYEAGSSTEYINVNLGVSDEFLLSTARAYIEDTISSSIYKAINN